MSEVNILQYPETTTCVALFVLWNASRTQQSVVSTGWAIGWDFSVHVEVFLNVGLEGCPRDEGFSIDSMNCISRNAF